MFRHGMRLLVPVCAALAALAAPPRPQGRSFWPFGSSSGAGEEGSASPRLSRENIALLEKAGLGKSFSLDGHELWRLHKYEGIELKPVALPERPEGPIDTSALDRLAALAQYLPEGPDGEPGLLEDLLFRLWSASSQPPEPAPVGPEELRQLPDSRGPYLAVLPGAAADETLEAKQPRQQPRQSLDQSKFSRSSVWLASWTPSANGPEMQRTEQGSSSPAETRLARED